MNKKIINIFKGMLDHYYEKILNAYANTDDLICLLKNNVNIINENILLEALDKNKGIIFVTGHFGGIELLPSLFSIKGYPVSIFCRFQNHLFSKNIKEKALKVGINIIDTNNNNNIKDALLALKNNNILIIECDELTIKKKKNHNYTYFLGYKIPYNRIIDILQKRSGSPVIFGLMYRNNNNYILVLDNNKIFDIESNFGITITQKCLKILEKAICYYPDQWYQWNKLAKYIN